MWNIEHFDGPLQKSQKQSKILDIQWNAFLILFATCCVSYNAPAIYFRHYKLNYNFQYLEIICARLQ